MSRTSNIYEGQSEAYTGGTTMLGVGLPPLYKQYLETIASAGGFISVSDMIKRILFATCPCPEDRADEADFIEQLIANTELLQAGKRILQKKQITNITVLVPQEYKRTVSLTPGVNISSPKGELQAIQTELETLLEELSKDGPAKVPGKDERLYRCLDLWMQILMLQKHKNNPAQFSPGDVRQEMYSMPIYKNYFLGLMSDAEFCTGFSPYGITHGKKNLPCCRFLIADLTKLAQTNVVFRPLADDHEALYFRAYESGGYMMEIVNERNSQVDASSLFANGVNEVAAQDFYKTYTLMFSQAERGTALQKAISNDKSVSNRLEAALRLLTFHHEWKKR